MGGDEEEIFIELQRERRLGRFLFVEVKIIASDLGKFEDFSSKLDGFPLQFTNILPIDACLGVVFDAIWLRNRNVLKTSLIL